MTNENPLEHVSLAQYAQDLRSGKRSVEATVDQYLKRISELNPKLDAITELDTVRALAAARGIDCLIAAGQDLGPLAGVPILVKDLFKIHGMKTTAGSRMNVDDLAPKEEGRFIQALRRAGCIILGKTRTTEFAMGGFNLTHPLPWNPVDMDVKRMTGGSSHGSAVAMAAGLCAFSVGSDTGGSVRQPAPFTGTVGYKSHRHYWPTDGVFPMSPSLDSVGILQIRQKMPPGSINTYFLAIAATALNIMWHYQAYDLGYRRIIFSTTATPRPSQRFSKQPSCWSRPG